MKPSPFVDFAEPDSHTVPCVIALEWWPGMIDNKWGTYALVTVLLSYPYCHAILVAWTSKNSNNVGTRSVSAALYNVSFIVFLPHTQYSPAPLPVVNFPSAIY